MNIFERILQFQKTAIGVILALTLLAGLQLPNLKIHTDLKSLIPHDQTFTDDQRITNAYSLKDILIMGITLPPGTLNAPLLSYLETLSIDIESIEGVYKVRSIFSEDNIKELEGGLDIGPFILEITSETAAELTKEINSFPGVQGLLATKDLSCISFLVELETDADKNRVYENINQVIVGYSPPDGVEFFMSGMPVFEGVLGVNILQDLLLLLPLLALIIALFLYLSYRSWLLVCVALLEIAVVDIWTLGFMAFVGAPLYLIQAVMPVILMALVVADEIHIFSKYFELTEQKDKRTRIVITMQKMWRPVVLTSITTGLGFLSFMATSMKPLQFFGIFTAFGICSAMFFSLIMTPVLMNLWRSSTTFKQPLFWEGKFSQLGNLFFIRQKEIRVLVLILIAVSILGINKLYIQDSWTGNFKEQSRVSSDNEVLNNTLAGTRVIHLEFDTGKVNGVKGDDFLKGLTLLQAEVDRLAGVGKTLSLLQLVSKMNKEFSGEYAVPGSDLVSQYLLLLEGSSYDNLWDFDYQKCRLSIYCQKGDYIFADELLPEIEKIIHRHLPLISHTFAGDLPLSHHWVSLLSKDQISSLFAAFFLICGAAAIFLRSFRKGVLVILPIILAVMVNFAIMGFGNIPISVASSMFSSIIFGVGIDYVIHLQNEFDVLCKTLPVKEAMRRTFSTVGVAIYFDGIIVIAGFLVLLFSNQPPNHMLGIMIAMGVAISIVTSFLVLPIFWCREVKEGK